MSGSRLGRGRGGRLAVYGGCGVVIILLVFLYRAATSEMARLRELHIQCVHQHESLAAQLQVIFEYKVRLEKSLAEEKSSNAMVKQELQQRASREKSLRDKDSMEAMQRFKSLQQSYKILQTEHRDLEEECKKQEAHAYEEKNRLESMQESVIKRIVENKDKIISEKENTLERFKNKYFDLETEKETLEEKYKDLIKSTGNTDSTIEHLKKEVFQLRTKVEETKKQCKSTLAETNLVNPKESHQSNDQNLTGNAVIDPTQQEEQQQQQKHVQEQEQQEQQQQQQAQQQQQQQQNMQEVVISSSSMKTTILSSSSSSSSSMKLETSTKLNNIDSVSSNKVMKTSSKVKIPPGVLPILMIMDQNVEKIDKEKKINNKREGEKNDVTGQNYITLKKKNIIPEVNSKEKENQIDKDKDKNNDNDNYNNNIDNNDNIDLPYKILSAKKYDDDENVDGRRQNGNWFKVKPGVQEFGEEPNPIDRLAGLESIVGRQFDTGDDQYVGADFEAHAQKVDDLRLAEGEEEEDEDDPEDII